MNSKALRKPFSFDYRIYRENLKILQLRIMSWLKISFLGWLKLSIKSKVVKTMFLIKELQKRFSKVYWLVLKSAFLSRFFYYHFALEVSITP